MALGIDKSKQLIEAFGEFSCEVILVVRKPGWDAITRVGKIYSELRTMIGAAPDVLPELADLDGDEVGELGKVSFEAIKKAVLCLAK